MVNFLAHVEACVLINVDAICDQWFILFTPIYNGVGCERGPFPFVFEGGELARFFLCASVVIAPHQFSFENGNRSLDCFHSKQSSDRVPFMPKAGFGVFIHLSTL